ncbi:syntaxin binding protein 1 [Elasticomyces elasticus]|nr:syntaxin binding protein 1 [Elasticomyces elasticus]
MDIYAPILHEFTYQAMAHDLLPIKDGDKTTYRTMVNEGRPDQEEKDVEISEKDRIWVENRHRHMKDTIEKLMGDFQKFIDQNPHFTNTNSGNANSLNAIKDMMAGLPQFQEMKEAYSLHLSMAQECMNIFQRQKLPDLASVEQTLATGLDEDYRKPKGLADQVIRALDEESVSPSDRLRLMILYLLFKDGILPADLQKLLAHAQLPSQDGEIIQNLRLLGARTARNLKDSRPLPNPLFPRNSPAPTAHEEYSLSRFEPAMQNVLRNHISGTLDPTTFPYTKPPLDLENTTSNVSATSLRSAKPTWAKQRATTNEPRQRIVVFMAGGATYSESRACYDIGRTSNRDVFLVTSHMLTPALFMRQVGDLSVDKRRLGIPAEQPKQQAPAHLFEKEEVKQQSQPTKTQQRLPTLPTQAIGNMSLGSRMVNGVPSQTKSPQTSSKLTKEREPETEKKKKHHFFSSKKG